MIACLQCGVGMEDETAIFCEECKEANNQQAFRKYLVEQQARFPSCRIEIEEDKK